MWQTRYVLVAVASVGGASVVGCFDATTGTCFGSHQPAWSIHNSCDMCKSSFALANPTQERMGRPCTKCPSTTVQSCCGNRNLRVASVLIGFFKLLMFLSAICLLISVMAGNSGATDTEKQLSGHSTGQLLIMLALTIAQLFLTLILLAGLFKKRRNYVMIYWASNCVLIVLTLLGLFTQPPGVGQFLLTFAYVVMDIYFQMVIRSHYLEMTGAAAATVEEPKPQVGARY